MTPDEKIRRAYRLIDSYIENNLYAEAVDCAKENGLDIEVINGQIIDKSCTVESWLRKFVTINPEMQSLKKTVSILSNVNDPVLITGPTGTGKELLARALHSNKEGNFVAINCAGMPENLIESELFGHTGNAFTGANKTKQGLMTIAQDGTLFMDEVAELPVILQGKLLRALQENTIRKVGGDKEEQINCRFVCATNKPIIEMVRAGLFRIDLYARISTFELKTIGLADRPEDVEPILKSMPDGSDFVEAFHKSNYTLDKLDLMFNVRSLQQYIRRFKVLGKLDYSQS